MVVPFVDSVTGTVVYINPDNVMTMRPDPDKIDSVTIIKLRDGETIRVIGEHSEVAEKLSPAR